MIDNKQNDDALNNLVAQWKSQGVSVEVVESPLSLQNVNKANQDRMDSVVSVSQTINSDPSIGDDMSDALGDGTDVGSNYEHNPYFKPYKEVISRQWGDEFPYYGTQEVFGIKINADNSVTVYNALAYRRGDSNSPYYSSGGWGPYSSGVTIYLSNGTDQIIQWKWDISGTTIEIESAASLSADTGTVFYGAVAMFNVTDGVPKLTVRIQCGNPVILPVFAPA